MQASELREFLTKHITNTHQLILDSNLLPEAGQLAADLLLTQIAIDDAKPDPTAQLPTITGKASFLGLTNIDVTLTGGGDEHSTWLQLEAGGIPSTWRLSNLGKLPQYWAVADDGFALDLKDSFLNDITMQQIKLVLSTCDSENDTVKPGINLFGGLLLDADFADGLAADVLQHLKGNAPLPLSGTIQLSHIRPPVIDLRASLGDSLFFDIGSLHLSSPFIWLRTLTPPEMIVPVSRMELAVKTFIGSPKPMEMTISTELVAKAGQFVFRGTSEDESFSLANGLTDIASLIGVSADILSMPAGLQELSKLYVREMMVGLSSADKKPQFVSLSLALPIDPPWKTPIPKLSVESVQTGWTYAFGGGLEGYVAGTVQIGTTKPANIHVSASFPDFQLNGRLDSGADGSSPISITEVVGQFIDVSDLPEIDIAELTVSAKPNTGDLYVSGSLKDDWSFRLGKLPSFSIKDVYFFLNLSKASGFSGMVGGQATLGSATFDSSYSFPGNSFVIDGKLPQLQLRELVSTLCDNAIPFPDSLNVTLHNSDIAIAKSGNDYTFFLQTNVSELGMLFFEIQRTAAQGWGAAVGFDLSVVKRLGEVPGFGFLNQIDLTLERLAIVLCSVDLPVGYVFPDLSTYQSTASPAGNKVKIPSGIGAPKQGVNAYAQFAFGDRSATKHEPLLKLYDFFSFQRIELDVAVQVSEKDGDLTALLMAGVSVSGDAYGIGGASQTNHMDVAAYLAIQYSAGNVSVFLRGLLKLDAPHTNGDKLSFAMELGVQENGFYVAGSMVGSWIDAFGIQGFTVSDVALEVGADWEGIPTVGFAGTFTMKDLNGSVACILNSENPQQSVLAGSLSDLSLGKVIRTFVSVSKPDPAAQAIIDVLDSISIEGIRGFNMPLSVADDLDNKDLKAVAQAFATYGPNIPLTPAPEATLLVVGVPGQVWYITDKANGAQHYEITRDGGSLRVKLEAQLYAAPFATNIAGLTFQQGYKVYGMLNMFGLSLLTDVTISASQGIAVEERLSEIRLFNGLLQVSRAPGDTRGDGEGNSATRNGPYLSLSTYTQPSKPDPYLAPHLYVSGAISFLGIANLVLDIGVSKAGLHVHIKRDLFGTDFDFLFDFSTSPLSLSGSGTAGVVLNPKIDLRKYGLGTYSIVKADFSASLSFGVNAQNLTAHASGNFDFEVPEFGVKLGPYHLELDLLHVEHPFTKLASLFEEIVHDIDTIARDIANVLLQDAKRFVELVKQGFIELDDSLDNVLNKLYNVTLADITATTRCFAEHRLAQHMLQAPATAGLDSEDSLNRLRQLRADLGTSLMGRWILNIYNALSDPLVQLYDYKPKDPNDVTFKQVLDAYNGDAVYRELIDMLQTSGTVKPINMTSDFVTNSQYIIAGTIDLAGSYASDGDPHRMNDAAIIKQGTAALLNQIVTLQSFASQGLNYEQLKQKLAQMTPPPDPFHDTNRRFIRMSQSTDYTGRSPTEWESLLITVVQSLLRLLPNIIVNGYNAGNLHIPSYTNVALPDVKQFDSGQKLVLCPILYKPVDNTRITVSGNRMNGLDSLTAYSAITFPVQDVEMSIPLLYADIAMSGLWQTHSLCQRDTSPTIETIHNGTYVVHFKNVQVTLNVKLDEKATEATAVTVTLTDTNSAWDSQPIFDPNKDVTFDSSTTEGQKIVLNTMMNSAEFRSRMKEPLKQAIEGEAFGGEICKVINNMLTQVLWAE